METACKFKSTYESESKSFESQRKKNLADVLKDFKKADPQEGYSQAEVDQVVFEKVKKKHMQMMFAKENMNYIYNQLHLEMLRHLNEDQQHMKKLILVFGKTAFQILNQNQIIWKGFLESMEGMLPHVVNSIE